jgi:FixJ family two-component response regulator
VADRSCLSPAGPLTAHSVPAFLQTLTERDRQMALALAEGHAARRVADQFGPSPGRVTQLRRQWQREWLLFRGETEHLPPAPRPV